MPLPRLHRRPTARTVGAAAAAAVIGLSALGAAPASAQQAGTHRVGPGETLSEIAARYGVSASALARGNGVTDPDRLLAGRTLTIAGASGGSATHRVVAGESLSTIAARYGTTVRSLAAANGIADTSVVLAGSRLRITPSTGTATSSGATGAATTHTVRPGETLSAIAVRFGVPAAAIARANGIVDRDSVRAGARLRLPAASARAPRGAAGRVETLIEDAAARFGWDAALIKALAWQESGWNNGAVSSVNARGIMQVLPSTNRDVSERRAGRSLDLSDPAENIEAGMHYLELLEELVGRDTEAILAGYYQGVRSVNQNGRYPSTERYIDNVLALRDRFARSG